MRHDCLTHEEIEDDRYELLERPVHRFHANRREFARIVGAGIVVSVSAGQLRAQRRRRRRRRGPSKLSDRLHIGQDGMITVLSGKVEVGQGSRTQIAQAAAEELQVDVSQVRVLMADTEDCPNDGSSAGSRTTPSTIPQIRAAAATAKQILIAHAAGQWDVEPSQLRVSGGKVVNAGSGQQLSYGQLAARDSVTDAFEEGIPSNVAVRNVEVWSVLGTSVQKVNGRDVVTGAAKYPSDIRLPNMLYGKILRPISFDANLTSIDLNPAQEMEGVVVARDNNFVGCAAPSSMRAAEAVEAIAATANWEEATHPSSGNLFQFLKENASGSPRIDSRGDVDRALNTASKKRTAEYEIAYIQHAPMEPRAAVAQWSDGKLTVWTGTQNPQRVKGELTRTFRLPSDRVRVIVPDTGGGFGGKHTGEVATEAARLAQAAGRPVSVRWSREEEFTWAYFRPAGWIEIAAALDQNGKITAWDMANYNSGSSALSSPYAIANKRTKSVRCDSPLREGSYRALASTANNYARESFMDELAHAQGMDPLQLRLNHLPPGRLRNVLLAASNKFRWPDRFKKASRNRGIGLACGTEKRSYVAACAEVEVDRADGTIRVAHICQAFECGAVQNPNNLKAQVEGCIVMGLGGALSEEIRFENGRIQNGWFSDYIVPRLKDVPTMDIELLNRRDLESVGAGETPIIAVAPAVANAVFHATGVRMRSLPMKSELLKATG